MINFQSLSYYLFTLICFIFLGFIKTQDLKRFALLMASFTFHGLLFFYSKKHFLVLASSLLLIFYGLKWAQRSRHKNKIIYLALTYTLLILFFFKYDIVNAPLITLFPSLKLMLKPLSFIGISFFSFKSISLIIDIKRGGLKQNLNFVDYANYVLFFPCFLSGPLDKYDHFASQLHDSKNNPNSEQVFNSLFRVVWGAFKKGILADSLYGLSISSISYNDIMQIDGWRVLAGMYIYSWLLYIDFSGYSDIAIGISRLLGVTTPENFNRPFLSRNIQEFWNRWHISFMHWLRDYVFYPLQMSLFRMGLKNTLVNSILSYVVVFLLAGLWHGANLNYFLYGLSHALAFSAYLIYKKVLESKLSKSQLASYKQSTWTKALGVFITYNYFVFSLFFFLGYWPFFGRIL